MTAKPIQGYLYAFWETGSEGVHWSLMEDDQTGKVFQPYEQLHIISDGDGLTVFNPDGSVLWSGVIDLEFESGYRRFPLNPACGQQSALGYWVNGCQRGFAIDDWAYMFFGPDVAHPRYKQYLRAELRKQARE